jgi:hypothetical protein
LSPIPFQAAALLISAIAIVLAARALLRRRLHSRAGASVVDTVMEPLAGIYGLVLAFLVTSVADRTVQLRIALETERDAFNRARLIAQQLPAPLDGEIPRRLDAYAAAELAARARRDVSGASKAMLNEAWLRLAVFESPRASDGVLQAETLDQLRILEEQRRTAARASRYAHGVLIWLVLGVGSVSVIAVCIVASLGDPRGPLYLIALVAMIATTLYVLYALSRPLDIVPFQ